MVTFPNPAKYLSLLLTNLIYALAKHFRWHWPNLYGQDVLKFVIMFGDLHIEMAAPRSAGTLLKDIGWTGTSLRSLLAQWSHFSQWLDRLLH